MHFVSVRPSAPARVVAQVAAAAVDKAKSRSAFRTPSSHPPDEVVAFPECFEKLTVVNSQSEFGMSSGVSLERGKGGLFQRLSRAIGALLLRTVPLEHTTLQGCGGDPPLRLIARSDVLHFRAVRPRSDARTGA